MVCEWIDKRKVLPSNRTTTVKAMGRIIWDGWKVVGNNPQLWSLSLTPLHFHINYKCLEFHSRIKDGLDFDFLVLDNYLSCYSFRTNSLGFRNWFSIFLHLLRIPRITEYPDILFSHFPFNLAFFSKGYKVIVWEKFELNTIEWQWRVERKASNTMNAIKKGLNCYCQCIIIIEEKEMKWFLFSVFFCIIQEKIIYDICK